MSKFLFSEFENISAAAWKQQIQADLKGADYNDTLLWKTNEGVTVKPFYHNDTDHNTANIPTNNWKIAQQIDAFITSEANKKALEAIERGVESIIFVIKSEINITELLANIDVSTIELQFKFKLLNEKMAEEIIQLDLPHYYLNIDIVGHLAQTGNWYTSLKGDFSFIKTLVKKYPTQNILSVDTSVYQNAGATITQQLAYAIAHANEYFNNFKDDTLPQLQFITSTSGNYFFEVAKIRALKLLFKTLTEDYQSLNNECAILSYPSNRNKTIYDYNVNLLRTTTECMSAILGGATTVCNLPYDHIYHNSNDFGDRIARNQLLVLKNESAFDVVVNPADGSYYIETLTQQLAEKALEIFKLIETGGGFLTQLKEGIIQRKIKESGITEQEQFDNGSLVLLGTNKHPNMDDKMKHDLEKQPFVNRESRKTLIAPITARRISEKSDKNRLEQE